MTHSDLLQQGIVALKAGRKAQARTLLAQAVEQDENNEQAWLWLSGAVDSDAERRACLERVLSINPRNDAARRGLAHLQSGAAARPAGAASPLASQAALAPLARQPSPAGATALDAGNPTRPSAAPARRFSWILGLGVALALLALGLGLASALRALGLGLASALRGDGAQAAERAGLEPLYPTPYVVVYGRQSCSLTRQMMQDLEQREIDYIFKSTSDQPVRDELFPRMHAAGLETHNFTLPVVDVSGWLLVHPSISAVVKRHERALETAAPTPVD